jgi:acetyl esterase
MDSPSDSLSKSLPLDRNRELLKTAQEEVYKRVGDQDLRAYLWEPPGGKAPDYPRSAAAFFFSSGWDQGQVAQFAPHCVYFASRGMTTVAFEYRVSSRGDGGPLQAMSDARAAIRWLRLNAVELGINPGRIVGVGGSGGAHAMASTAVLRGFDDAGESTGISPVPNALVLFNPVLDTSKKGFGLERFPSPATAKAANLLDAVGKHLPPTLILHGTADRVIPFAGSYQYARACARKKNVCRLIQFEGQGHGFFNFNLSFEMYEATLLAMDEFLVELGFVDPDPDALMARVD